MLFWTSCYRMGGQENRYYSYLNPSFIRLLKMASSGDDSMNELPAFCYFVEQIENATPKLVSNDKDSAILSKVLHILEGVRCAKGNRFVYYACEADLQSDGHRSGTTDRNVNGEHRGPGLDERQKIQPSWAERVLRLGCEPDALITAGNDTEKVIYPSSKKF